MKKTVKIDGKNYPDNIIEDINKADLLIDNELYDEALSIFTDVIVNYPNEAYAYSIRGWLMQKKGEYSAAIIDYSNALKRKRDIPNTIWLRANCYEMTGELDNAINDYKTYATYGPDEAEAYTNIGLLYEYKKNYVEALVFYRKSNRIEKSRFLIDKIAELEKERGLLLNAGEITGSGKPRRSNYIQE